MSPNDLKRPVLVAGAGPVGLTMAAELARFRVPVRIVDKAPARTDKSKALAVWPRTLELLAHAGCADAFASTGLKAGAADIFAGNETIAHVPFTGLASPFPYLLMIPQSETERLLEEHLAALGGKVERSVELTAFTPSSDGVSCTLRRADGSSETFDASWLVGCDGAHSIVRQTLAMPFEGGTLATNFILADVHVAGPRVPASEVAIFWHEDGVIVFFPIAPGRYRIVADVGTNPRHDPTLEEVQAIVDRRGPGNVTLSDPVWLSGFGVNERKVREFRAGRVFVAGDAAHIHSPAGGQGMNTGMHDAFNLAWKLALVERGTANPALLDSYSIERSAVARQILTDSGHMIRAATLRGSLAQHVRNFVAHRLLGLAFVQRAIADRLSEITIGYPQSPINATSGDGLDGPGPAPGERIVDEAPFGTGDTPRFALMAADSSDVRGILAKYPALLEPALRKPLDARGAWLVRPDGYVAAVARADDTAIIDACLANVAS